MQGKSKLHRLQGITRCRFLKVSLNLVPCMLHDTEVTLHVLQCHSGRIRGLCLSSIPAPFFAPESLKTTIDQRCPRKRLVKLNQQHLGPDTTRLKYINNANRLPDAKAIKLQVDWLQGLRDAAGRGPAFNIILLIKLVTRKANGPMRVVFWLVIVTRWRALAHGKHAAVHHQPLFAAFIICLC
ncbi:uncharacterized protein LY79DRAFT_583709 [Colletotrichum navitas]|uniref:Uncharacterized protein n=1 Tax=Colletotrichum navitas TaxID=681940 RepID=A0AAD8PNF8_9PEZI|nr:uncharacterized protein LY79DRAFT_583709 [Colletotrichum navitas]KAK1573391.1 hypothetical protein LY79DRAFT_583709 [Colletotrichum navitas]